MGYLLLPCLRQVRTCTIFHKWYLACSSVCNDWWTHFLIFHHCLASFLFCILIIWNCLYLFLIIWLHPNFWGYTSIFCCYLCCQCDYISISLLIVTFSNETLYLFRYCCFWFRYDLHPFHIWLFHFVVCCVTFDGVCLLYKPFPLFFYLCLWYHSFSRPHLHNNFYSTIWPILYTSKNRHCIIERMTTVYISFQMNTVWKTHFE